MASRLDDGRIVFAPVAPAAPVVEPTHWERILAPLVSKLQLVRKPEPKSEPPPPRFNPAKCPVTVIRVRALRALGVPHTVIEEITGVPQRTSSDIATKAHGGRAEPTDADLLEAGERLARWTIEKRGRSQ